MGLLFLFGVTLAAGLNEKKKEVSPLPQPSRARATTRNSQKMIDLILRISYTNNNRWQ